MEIKNDTDRLAGVFEWWKRHNPMSSWAQAQDLDEFRAMVDELISVDGD